MKDKLLSLRRNLLEVIRKNPVELLLGLTFVVLAINWSSRNQQMLFPMWIVCTFIANRTCRRLPFRMLYYLSYFLFIPFFFISVSEYVYSSGYWYGLLVAGILFLSCGFCRDNVLFAKEAVSRVVSFFSALFIAMAFYLITIAIYASLIYIFNIRFASDYLGYEYIFYFTIFFIIPFAFLFFDEFSGSRKFESSGVFTVLLNFILSPALIIYTVILYLYFAKVLVTWELPKGNVAYMVFGFVLFVAMGKICQPLLKNRLYDWFYNRFSVITLPLLLMFWVGVWYRLNEYGITENRVYLVIAGVVMTLFTLLFLFGKTSRYLYVSTTAVMLFSLFTFIPGIAARDLDNRYRKEVERKEYVYNQTYYFNFETRQWTMDVSGYNKLLNSRGEEGEIEINEQVYSFSFDREESLFSVRAENDTIFSCNLNERLWQFAGRQGVDLTKKLKRDDLKPCVDSLMILGEEDVKVRLSNLSVEQDSIYRVIALSVDFILLK